MKRLLFLFLIFFSTWCNAYDTACVANFNCTNAGHFGNAPRSMMVDPSGQVCVATNWDENNDGIQCYQNGQTTITVGTHGGNGGSTIAGNATYFWTSCQFDSHRPVGEQNGCMEKTLRTSPYTVDYIYGVSSDNTERYKDLIYIAQWGQFVGASSIMDNVVKIYNTSDTLLYTWPTTSTPGVLAFNRDGNIWVAQGNQVVLYARATGTVLQTITLGTSSNVTALYFDPTTNNLLVGDSGPDEQVKVFNALGVLLSTFGDLGGYRNVATGIMGQGGATRFMRIDGIGKDQGGNLYILNQPWGGNFDPGRDGGADIHVFNPAGTLLWEIGGYNFEGNAAYDSTDSRYYGGLNIYTNMGYASNTVDLVDFPNDPRAWTNMSQYSGRDMGFVQEANVNGHRFMAVMGQDPDSMYFFYFNPPVWGDIAVPMGSIPGVTPFNETAGRVRAGFDLDENGDVIVSLDRPANVIWKYALTGFDVNGMPQWGTPVQYPVPQTMLNILGRAIYLPKSDTMILASKNTIQNDWTSLGARVEVYHNWTTNQTSSLVITLNTTLNPKTISAAGNYLFVGYVHTVPNIDAFNLTTGNLDETWTGNDNVYIGNDVDSMYGLNCKQKADSSYICTKDNYNGNSDVVFTGLPQ